MGKSLAFFEGKIIPVEDAKVGIMTHALHYGTGVFEGIRGNWNQEKNSIIVFRLREHYDRMNRGCKILNIELPYSTDDLIDITTELIQKCGYKKIFRLIKDPGDSISLPMK